ncbi:MAG: TIGR02449 family protein [Gammaproteobacteria bacterium]|nr:TIGR02449 family protein [Gammaproteobacteria bacterium]
MSATSISDEILQLESRLEDLTELHHKLKIENKTLREQQTSLVEERARLIEKNEMARSKVEQMIVRLKSLEAGQ